MTTVSLRLKRRSRAGLCGLLALASIAEAADARAKPRAQPMPAAPSVAGGQSVPLPADSDDCVGYLQGRFAEQGWMVAASSPNSFLLSFPHFNAGLVCVPQLAEPLANPIVVMTAASDARSARLGFNQVSSALGGAADA